jgi:Spx/MgsR family transcriptional regulator
MIQIYGIRNCDTMKKALSWLEAERIDYRFHDFKKVGVDAELLERWIERVGWERLLNRRGMMWRKLDPEIRDNIDGERARKVMLETPTIIKRPVLESGSVLQVGFSEAEYRALLK